jgi:hypothetical protein
MEDHCPPRPPNLMLTPCYAQIGNDPRKKIMFTRTNPQIKIPLLL